MSYVSEAAELVKSLSSDGYLLNSDDYVIISEWEKQEIPLVLVLKSIRDYFDDKEENSRKPLAGIKPDIRNKYAAWLRRLPPVSQKGSSDDIFQ